MRFLTLLCLLLYSLPALAQEHVILCGGPTLRKWENLRVKSDRHDQWWANFVRASTMQIDEIKKIYGANSSVTWIVYRDSYALRGREDNKPYTTWIQKQASKRKAKLVWVSSGDQAIAAINRLREITTFDYFGHSNRYCFMLDYGSSIMAVSQAWIHQDDLGKIKRRSFASNASCQSWGCHTGESMSAVWKRALGSTLVGAKGKTDYSSLSEGKMPAINGRWIR